MKVQPPVGITFCSEIRYRVLKSLHTAPIADLGPMIFESFKHLESLIVLSSQGVDRVVPALRELELWHDLDPHEWERLKLDQVSSSAGNG